MRVAVTGASGFVGGRVARTLAAAGHDVMTYGRRPASGLTETLPNYRVWDLESGDRPAAAADAVVHCAALVGDWGREQDYIRANVDGTKAVLSAFASARRFVQVSTSSVYSHQRVMSGLRETSPTGDCLTAYGRTKAAAESVVMRERPDAVILRPHIVYGPGDATLLPRVAAAVHFGHLAVPGTGANLLSVTHVDNLVAAVAAVLDNDMSGAFNIADAHPVTVDDLLRTIFSRAGIRADVHYVPRRLAWIAAAAMEAVWPWRRGPRGPLLTRYVVTQLADEHTLDISRAEEYLGYVPRWTHINGPLE